MTWTFDLFTSKSIGCILYSWGVSVWSFMIILGLITDSVIVRKPITINHVPWPWPLDLKINRCASLTYGSKCMKFHDHMLITKSVIVRTPITINHAPWPWPLDIKINRVHPWLIGSKCMNFHYYISKDVWLNLQSRSQLLTHAHPPHIWQI